MAIPFPPLAPGSAARSLPWHRRWRRLLLLLLLLNLPPGGGHRSAATPAPPALRRAFFALVRAGDSVYARKAGEATFARSLTYYDRALALAQQSADTLLLAEAIFAKGRVYDAWNQEPQKTVTAFQQAADLFRRLPGHYVRYLYAQHLVAHAYDKVPDSTRAVAVLRGLYAELRGQPDTLLRQVPFTVEMALTASEVHNYPLADSLLRQLTRRAWIRNDPATLDYLSHYYLVRARLAVLGTTTPPPHHPTTSPYLDSLQQAYRQTRNPYDRFYYAQNLARLHYATGSFRTAYDFQHTAGYLADSIAAGGDASQLRQALVRSEERAAARNRRYEAAARTARQVVMGLLGTGLFVISLLTFRLYRQRQTSRGQAARLAVVNRALDAHVAQVELLNKEMQHRIKNNLQMVFSLLQMQERRTTHPETIGHLQTARLRVESIAALHQQLLHRPDTLDLRAYLQTLVAAVVNCLANDRPVTTHLQIEAVPLAPEAYLPLSLILNEWVTNSIKYAAPAGPNLEIRVTVHARAHQIYLTYADNGLAPEPSAAHRPPGLGLEIIDLLRRQLDATLRTDPHHPYQYELLMRNEE